MDIIYSKGNSMKLKPDKLTKINQLFENQVDLIKIYNSKSLPSFMRGEILDDILELNIERLNLELGELKNAR